MVRFLQILVNGLQMGSIFALIALGYTMVYGIAKMINFAHGDIIMVGAYSMYVCLQVLKLPLAVCLLITVVICAVLGFTIEKVAYKPLRNAPTLAVLITAIGMSYLLQSIAQMIFTPTPKTLTFQLNIPSINIGEIRIQGIDLLTFAVTIVCMVLLTLFIHKTKMGSAMRAVSEDKQAAKLMGINVNKIISITFAIGSALAAIAGILYLFKFPNVKPTLGALPGIKAFVAAVIGGIGNVPGAMLGGLMLGVIENLAKGYLPTELTDAIVFGLLVIVLLVKPTGLLGKNRIEKV